MPTVEADPAAQAAGYTNRISFVQDETLIESAFPVGRYPVETRASSGSEEISRRSYRLDCGGVDRVGSLVK